MVLAAQPGSGGDQRMMEYYAMDKGIKAAVAMLVAGVAVAASAQEVVKIGTMSPLSGPQAHYGKDNVTGVRFAVEDLNAQGVTIGGKKIKFEVVAEDDGADGSSDHCRAGTK